MMKSTLLATALLCVLSLKAAAGVPFGASPATPCATAERISVDSSERGGMGLSYPGLQALSADNRYVAFVTEADFTGTDDDGAFDVYLRDRQAGQTRLVGRKCEHNGWVGQTGSPAISADGYWLSYVSESSCDTDADFPVVEVQNLATGEEFTASLDDQGRPEEVIEGASLSSDGGLIVYSNRNGHIILRDLKTGRRTVISDGRSPGEDDGANYPHITPDGRFITFQNENPASGLLDTTFLYDRTTGIKEILNIGPDGKTVSFPSYATISDDGRYAVFDGSPGVFLRDRRAGVTTKIQDTGMASLISPSGRYVAFTDFKVDATGETPFLYDRTTGLTLDIFAALDVATPNGGGGIVFRLSSDDRYALLLSYQDGLVPGDRNGNADAYLIPVSPLFADPETCSGSETQPTPSAGLNPNADADQDGVMNGSDNCPYEFNPGQQDGDDDGKGDFCDIAVSRSAPAAGGCELVRKEEDVS